MPPQNIRTWIEDHPTEDPNYPKAGDRYINLADSSIAFTAVAVDNPQAYPEVSTPVLKLVVDFNYVLVLNKDDGEWYQYGPDGSYFNTHFGTPTKLRDLWREGSYGECENCNLYNETALLASNMKAKVTFKGSSYVLDKLMIRTDSGIRYALCTQDESVRLFDAVGENVYITTASGERIVSMGPWSQKYWFGETQKGSSFTIEAMDTKASEEQGDLVMTTIQIEFI